MDFDWLENTVFLHALKEGERKLLGDVFEVTLFDVGDELVAEGGRSPGMYLLREGTADIACRRDERAIHLGCAEPGAVIGNISSFAGKPDTATVTAMGPLKAYLLTHENFCRLMACDRELAVNLLLYVQHYMSEAICRANEHLAALTVGSSGNPETT